MNHLRLLLGLLFTVKLAKTCSANGVVHIMVLIGQSTHVQYSLHDINKGLVFRDAFNRLRVESQTTNQYGSVRTVLYVHI